MFEPKHVNLDLLRERAFNLRWATLEPGIIPLTAADPDFPCAPEIAEAVIRFTRDRYLSYGPPEGLPAFKSSVARFFVERRNIPAAAPELVMPVDSAAFGIYLCCKAFLRPGDEAIIFDPVDFLFRYSVEAVGAIAVPLAIPPGAAVLDLERMESLIGSKTRLICLCNPLNPTGKVFTREELQAIGELACKYDLMILSDEIWSDIVYAPFQFTSIASLGAEIGNRTVTVTGYSKSYGLAGLRIGAVMAGNSLIFKRLFEVSLHSSTVHGANILGQVAVVAALDECAVYLDGFIAHLQEMRDYCVRELNATPGFHCLEPEGCYVAFADIRATGLSSREVHQLLLEQGRVAVVPGAQEWFGAGAEGYIRLSFATSADILGEAMHRIQKAMGQGL